MSFFSSSAGDGSSSHEVIVVLFFFSRYIIINDSEPFSCRFPCHIRRGQEEAALSLFSLFFLKKNIGSLLAAAHTGGINA